jgi:hypothetical protein
VEYKVTGVKVKKNKNPNGTGRVKGNMKEMSKAKGGGKEIESSMRSSAIVDAKRRKTGNRTSYTCVCVWYICNLIRFID